MWGELIGLFFGRLQLPFSRPPLVMDHPRSFSWVCRNDGFPEGYWKASCDGIGSLFENARFSDGNSRYYGFDAGRSNLESLDFWPSSVLGMSDSRVHHGLPASLGTKRQRCDVGACFLLDSSVHASGLGPVLRCLTV